MRTTQPGRLYELFAWTLVGVGAGLAVGLALGEWIDWRRPAPAAPEGARLARPGSAAATASAVREALAGQEAFATLEIAVTSVAPGIVELGGWVDDRVTRGRLARFASDLPEIDDIINSVMVHGEDDRHGNNGHRTSSS